MSRSILAAGVAAVMMSVAVRADQAPAVPGEDLAKSQTLVYEMALRNAVTLGAQRLAQQALEAFPGAQLTTEEPIVRGVRLPDYGFHFDVQAPDIQSTILVVDIMRRTQRGGAAARPVAQGRTAAAGGLIEADPMAPGSTSFDPDQAYSSYVREALINAMLDSSAVLPLAAGERLTVTASGIDQPDNRLYPSRKLILSIGADDLQQLHQGQISREEARARIVEERF